MGSELPDIRIGIFASPFALGNTTSSAARSAAGRRGRLQAELLRNFPQVSEDELLRILIACHHCEHAISVGKFVTGVRCTQCGQPVGGPKYGPALSAMMRLSKEPLKDFKDFLQEIPCV